MKSSTKYILFILIGFFAVCAILVAIFKSTYMATSAFLLLLFVAGIVYAIMDSRKNQVEEQRKFEGQVAGFFACLALTSGISEYRIEDIYRFAKGEIKRRWNHIGKEFPFFCISCIEEYLSRFPDDLTEDELHALQDFCHEHENNARHLTAHIPHPWQ